MSGASDQQVVSVVIAAYRNRATLPMLLALLAPQIKNSSREVIVVDSSEPDLSSDISASWPWLKFVRVDRPLSCGEARNHGASLARGDRLAFIDADAIPMEGWLDRLEAALTPQVDVVAGAILNGTPESAVGTADYLLSFSEWLPTTVRQVPHAAGCNMLVRRSVFQTAGGFIRGQGEDTILSLPLAQA